MRSLTTLLASLIWMCASCSLISAQEYSGPESAILFIGDGMGPAQVTAARIYQSGAAKGKLTIDALPHTAMVRTWSADNMVTDSAASGTALATGHKTNNAMVAVKPDGAPVETILEKARRQGKAVGVVTTTRLTHATPACFYAHVPQRNQENEIAAQLIDGEPLDVAMGGGRANFMPVDATDEEEQKTGRRRDGRNLIEEAKQKGYTILMDKDDWDAALQSTVLADGPEKVLGLFSMSHMAYELDRPDDVWGEPSLAEMTQLAIALLSRDPDGFFLMVEGGRIDHAAHGNQAHYMMTDLLAFDEAVKTALDAVGDEGRTLIVVTADHETGGLAVNGYAPLETQGPKMLEPGVAGIPSLLTFATGPGAGENAGELAYDDPEIRQPVAVESRSAHHTGVDVIAWASGPGAEVFSGTIDNTDVAKNITEALGLDKPQKAEAAAADEP